MWKLLIPLAVVLAFTGAASAQAGISLSVDFSAGSLCIALDVGAGPSSACVEDLPELAGAGCAVDSAAQPLVNCTLMLGT